MSFMNPVDLVEEDAADLQFPKGNGSIQYKVSLPLVNIWNKHFSKLLENLRLTALQYAKAIQFQQILMLIKCIVIYSQTWK